MKLNETDICTKREEKNGAFRNDDDEMLVRVFHLLIPPCRYTSSFFLWGSVILHACQLTLEKRSKSRPKRTNEKIKS